MAAVIMGNNNYNKTDQHLTLQNILIQLNILFPDRGTPGGGGGGGLGSSFAGYVPLASQNPYPIIVYSVASYRPHLSHFWANVIVISRMEFNVS